MGFLKKEKALLRIKLRRAKGGKMSKKKRGMTYKGTGVDYDAMDPFKRAAQRAGLATAKNMQRLGLQEVEESRGESAYLVA